MSDDARHMRHAIALGARGEGRTGRVPSVGCVLVAPDGHIAGRGRTDESGRPHAEAAALLQADGAARGATAYVTLEPCAHVGTTGGPCAEALIAAGVARVVVACVDPDPRTNGQGHREAEGGGDRSGHRRTCGTRGGTLRWKASSSASCVRTGRS